MALFSKANKTCDKYFYAIILRWKQNQNIENLIVSLINYQDLIAINIILYVAKEQGESF